MSAADFLRNRWPAITIAVTTAAIAGAAIVMVRGMPPAAGTSNPSAGSLAILAAMRHRHLPKKAICLLLRQAA